MNSADMIKRLHENTAMISDAVKVFITDACNSFIAQKCQDNEDYCQSLYAALCNNMWKKNQLELLVTWRYAGEIASILRQQDGNYLDWYCSGIGDDGIPEGTILHGILEDLLEIGWRPVMPKEGS